MSNEREKNAMDARRRPDRRSVIAVRDGSCASENRQSQFGFQRTGLCDCTKS